jgi:hypothetical protein
MGGDNPATTPSPAPDIDYVSKALVGTTSPILGLVTSYQE